MRCSAFCEASRCASARLTDTMEAKTNAHLIRRIGFGFIGSSFPGHAMSIIQTWTLLPESLVMLGTRHGDQGCSKGKKSESLMQGSSPEAADIVAVGESPGGYHRTNISEGLNSLNGTLAIDSQIRFKQPMVNNQATSHRSCPMISGAVGLAVCAITPNLHTSRIM